MSQPRDILAKLLDAHVQHELNMFEGDAFQDVVTLETEAWLSEFDSIRPGDIGDPEVWADLIIQALVADPVPDFLPAVVVPGLQELFESLRESNETLGELVPPEVYKQSVENAIVAEKVRTEVVHTLLNNAIFAYLIAEILFSGIQDFLNEYNVLQHIPGASKLLKFGQNLVSQAAPGLSENLEKRIKEFIAQNTNKTILNSEKILNRGLTPEFLRESADGLWKDFRNRRPANLPDYIDARHFPDYMQPFLQLWDHLRETEFFRRIVRRGAHIFFEHNAEASITGLLNNAGIHSDLIQRTIKTGAPPIIRRLKQSGFLEARIRNRLRGFYESDMARDILKNL